MKQNTVTWKKGGKAQPNVILNADTHIIVIILYGLSCEVEHSPGYDALTDEVADFKVSS